MTTHRPADRPTTDDLLGRGLEQAIPMEVAKLDLRPDDTLVVRLDAEITHEIQDVVTASVRKRTGHERVLVIGRGVDLVVVGADVTAERAGPVYRGALGEQTPEQFAAEIEERKGAAE